MRKRGSVPHAGSLGQGPKALRIRPNARGPARVRWPMLPGSDTVLARRRSGCCTASASAGPEISVRAFPHGPGDPASSVASSPSSGLSASPAYSSPNGVYDLLFIHLGIGPVTSTTIATVVATIASYLGNRYWSFRARQRTGVVREIIVFAVLNGIGLLIQDAAVGFNYYLLHLGHNEVAGLVALNAGIALATLFRFWSYRRFVWVTPRGNS
ncbi:MAG TPA: GtrA family protein [Streptosporangiaceae bacterium]|nr:GtrA family protein [Streptosporangiaceae bacterium]